MGGTNRKTQHKRLASRRAQSAKMRKLRQAYQAASSPSSKQEIEQKLLKLAPYLNITQYLKQK